jgi:hypothetical protein
MEKLEWFVFGGIVFSLGLSVLCGFFQAVGDAIKTLVLRSEEPLLPRVEAETDRKRCSGRPERAEPNGSARSSSCGIRSFRRPGLTRP